MTRYATIQIDTHTVYGIGDTPDLSRDDAAREGMACACDEQDNCPHHYGELLEGFATVPCTPAAAAYVAKHGGAPSSDLSVDRNGVCLRSEE